MKLKKTSLVVISLALASFGLMGCESGVEATVKDADGNKYPTVEFAQQIWMAKNLNVNIEGSMCYYNDPANCEKYGRLYTWEAAISACPSGWHLPSRGEIDALLAAGKLRVEQLVTQKKLNAEPLIKGEDDFYNHLRDKSWSGFDTYGFSVLPAGVRHFTDKLCQSGEPPYNMFDCSGPWFEDLGFSANFWVADGSKWGINGSYASSKDTTSALSIRCLKD